MKVAAFTSGKHEPSARFRVRQYVNPLKELDVELTEFISQSGTYPPASILMRPWWAVRNLAEHFAKIPATYKYDLVLFQREFFSSYYTLEGMTKRPRLLDVDDAIWLQKSGNFARKIANYSQGVICGNNFLADYFSKWNKDIFIIPTGIDLSRYQLSDVEKKPAVVWCGSSSNFKHLYHIEHALAKIFNSRKDVWLRIIANSIPDFKFINSRQIEFIKWSPENELKYLRDAIIGIMPLENSEWARGKCGFKMLTYMASVLPVVVSKVGMNNEILQLGEAGIGVDGDQDWINAIDFLISNRKEAIRMGMNGRKIIEEHFDSAIIAEKIAEIMHHFE